jgi:hypothetical protein
VFAKWLARKDPVGEEQLNNKRRRRMKTLRTVVVMLLVVGTANSWAQNPSIETDNILDQAPVTLKAKVSNAKTAVTDTNLSFAVVHIFNVDGSDPTLTNVDITLTVLGDSLAVVSVPETNFVGFDVTNQVLEGTLYWVGNGDVDPASASKTKFLAVYTQNVPINDKGTFFGPGVVASNLGGVISNQVELATDYSEKTNDVIGWTAGTAVDGSTILNSTLLVSGTSSDDGSNATAKITGIWEDGTSTVSGSFSATKGKIGKK